MDDKMMTALLKSYGAPMSAANANAARQFFASNPDVAEHRAMGMRGSAVDDNSDLLDVQLDKHIADTAIPEGRVEVGQPILESKAGVPAPSKLGAGPNDRAPVNRPAQPSATGDKRATQYGEGTGEQFGPENQADTGGFGKWLLTLLGASSGGALAGARNGGGGGRSLMLALPAPMQQLPAPDLRITDQRPNPNVEALGAEKELIDQRNAAGRTQQRAQVQQSVDQENEDITRQMQKDLEKQAAQRRAQSTVNAAKRAVGRK